MSKTTKVTIQGIVIAARWRNNGTVSAVDIAGYDEQRYSVENDFMGERIRMFTQKKVIVDGIVTTENNRKKINVHRFQVVDLEPASPKAEKE